MNVQGASPFQTDVLISLRITATPTQHAYQKRQSQIPTSLRCGQLFRQNCLPSAVVAHIRLSS